MLMPVANAIRHLQALQRNVQYVHNGHGSDFFIDSPLRALRLALFVVADGKRECEQVGTVYFKKRVGQKRNALSTVE